MELGMLCSTNKKDAVCESIPAPHLFLFLLKETPMSLAIVFGLGEIFIHMEVMWNGKKLHIVDIHIKANFLMPEKDRPWVKQNQ